jgi:hypothetical protein
MHNHRWAIRPGAFVAGTRHLTAEERDGLHRESAGSRIAQRPDSHRVADLP